MSSFSIIKHVGGDWSIDKGGARLHRMAWDEMLGDVALRLLGSPKNGGQLLWDDGDVPWGGVYELEVSTIEERWYTIRVGDRFIDRLDGHEALGFIAAYTLTDGEKQLFSGLQTYEQWDRRHRYFERDHIAGLLTYQGGAA